MIDLGLVLGLKIALTPVDPALSIKPIEQAIHVTTPKTPEFPTVQEIAVSCDADSACHQAKEDMRIQKVVDSHQVSTGNNYAWGNCTWYVAGKRQIGLSYGNAYNWIWAASHDGYEVGDKPYKGAIGVTQAGWAGHVVYVEAVNPDNTVTISEMNYNGLGMIDVRNVAISDFKYIY